MINLTYDEKTPKRCTINHSLILWCACACMCVFGRSPFKIHNSEKFTKKEVIWRRGDWPSKMSFQRAVIYLLESPRASSSGPNG